MAKVELITGAFYRKMTFGIYRATSSNLLAFQVVLTSLTPIKRVTLIVSQRIKIYIDRFLNGLLFL